jgi:hypothetical protein
LLQHVSFEGGHQFWSPDEPVPFALFPLRGIVSLEMPVAPNRLVEVGIVGREGFVGVPLFLGLEHALFVPMALTRGEAIIMPPEVFRAYLRNIAFKSAVERYVHQLIAMLAEISLCNRVHDIEKVWVGRLLLIQDRTQTDSFQISQEFFSRVLGVRRASLNQVAADLQSQGAIAYDRRGWLTIRDRRQLEDRACSCYHALKARFDPRMRKVVS